MKSIKKIGNFILCYIFNIHVFINKRNNKICKYCNCNELEIYSQW